MDRFRRRVIAALAAALLCLAWPAATLLAANDNLPVEQAVLTDAPKIIPTTSCPTTLTYTP